MAAIKYLVDELGQRTSVLVPVKMWNDLNEKFGMLQKKLAVFQQIQDGITEVRNARRSGKKLQTLEDYLK